METQVEQVAAPKANIQKFIMPIILLAILIGGGLYGYNKYQYGKIHEDTDDAQVDGNINPVVPRVSGYVLELRVKENQHVKKGDTLMRLDDRDLVIKVQQAKAALDNASANLQVVEANAKSTEANLATAQANIDAAKTKVWKTEQDYTRYQNLLNDKSGTQQQFDNAKAEKESAESQVNVTKKQYEAAQLQYKAANQQAAVAQTQIQQRKTELDYAQLQLSYAVIVAPTDGHITRKSVQEGQYLQAGQQVMTVVENSDVWVVANYKETQMKKMTVGAPVEVFVDAYGDKIFKGHIESIASGTGAKFSLLPPDNSSGNFVKVVQRVPVKIVLDQQNDSIQPLRVGMSVRTSVSIK